jgi:translation initiation factor 1 (eIF-1/SUI1)
MINKIEEIENELMENIDRKITIKVVKEHGKHRTYISGLEYFLDEDEVDKFVKSLKKRLGMGMSKKDNMYCFQGNHVDNIKKIIFNEIDSKIKIA